MKIYYLYSDNTKELIGSEEVQENPRKKGTYLTPPNATDKEPPTFLEGEIPVWSEKGGWTLVKDNRGKTIWSTYSTSKTLEDLGEIPEGWSLERPPKPLETAKEEALSAIEAFILETEEDTATTNLYLRDRYKSLVDIAFLIKNQESLPDGIYTDFDKLATHMGMTRQAYIKYLIEINLKTKALALKIEVIRAEIRSLVKSAQSGEEIAQIIATYKQKVEEEKEKLGTLF